jgi:diguanylate cyclase (GGDEF)-like protein
MPPDTTYSVQDQLDELRQAYITGLSARVDQLTSVWNTLLQEEWNATALNTMLQLIHKLAGSGATFGFTSLSNTAHTIERYLLDIQERNDPLTSEEYTQISALMEVVCMVAKDPTQHASTLAWKPYLTLNQHFSGAHGRLVYLVEDDLLLARELALELEQSGYTVHIFAHPRELEQVVYETPPSVIVMDIMFAEDRFAGITGIAQIRQFREVTIPVLFISARNDLPARLHAVRVGGVAYFTKPINVPRLIEQLDQLTVSPKPEPYRVLIVDDDQVLAEYYALTLQQHDIVAKIITDPLEVMAGLVDFQPDLILMDLYMPDWNGLELAAVIRQQQTFVGVPIVFLSTEINLDKQLAAIKLGGDDFLTKPIQPERLIAAIIARVQRSRTLQSYMMRDGLTGLLNRTTMKDLLSTEVARAQRHATPLTLAMLDIDNFKQVNDTLGHTAGDWVLKKLARLLQQRLRATDIIGRYGGDEFAVILPNTDALVARSIFEEICQGFAHVQQQDDSTTIPITCSCGIAAFSDDHDPNSLNEAADSALYGAKRAGRNRVVSAEAQEQSMPT